MLGVLDVLNWNQIEQNLKDLIIREDNLSYEKITEFDSEIFEFDKSMCGINRENFLRCWYSKGNFEKLKVRSKESGKLKGYGMSIDYYQRCIMIGPIVCDDLKTSGLLLFLKLLQRAKKDYLEPGRAKCPERKEIFIHIYNSSGLSEIIEKFGFVSTKRQLLSYMTYEFPDCWDSRFKSIFATCSGNYGPF